MHFNDLKKKSCDVFSLHREHKQISSNHIELINSLGLYVIVTTVMHRICCKKAQWDHETEESKSFKCYTLT